MAKIAVSLGQVWEPTSRRLTPAQRKQRRFVVEAGPTGEAHGGVVRVVNLKKGTGRTIYADSLLTARYRLVSDRLAEETLVERLDERLDERLESKGLGWVMALAKPKP